jgi:glucose/mannose-6-phosphate isomerase
VSPLDSLGMRDLALGLPEQIEAAAAGLGRVPGLPDHERIENVVVLGMGGSGMAGDVMAAIAGPFMPVPVVVQKGYAPPQFVSDRTLVFAVSCSGDTEEVVEAASLAGFDGARMVVVSQGGRLAALAPEWGAPHVRVDPDIPMPRAAFGALSVPPLLLLEQVGLFPGAAGWVAEGVEQLRRRRDQLLLDSTPVDTLVEDLDGRIPIFYGGGSLGEVAALRWKNQCNENAELPAFTNAVPELTHNEICAWGPRGGDRSRFALVTLRSDHEHPQVARRFAYLDAVARPVMGAVHEVRAEGEGALAQLLDLVLLGDLVSIELAYRLGVDPGPIKLLEDLKLQIGRALD